MSAWTIIIVSNHQFLYCIYNKYQNIYIKFIVAVVMSFISMSNCSAHLCLIKNCSGFHSFNSHFFLLLIYCGSLLHIFVSIFSSIYQLWFGWKKKQRIVHCPLLILHTHVAFACKNFPFHELHLFTRKDYNRYSDKKQNFREKNCTWMFYILFFPSFFTFLLTSLLNFLFIKLHDWFDSFFINGKTREANTFIFASVFFIFFFQSIIIFSIWSIAPVFFTHPAPMEITKNVFPPKYRCKMNIFEHKSSLSSLQFHIYPVYLFAIVSFLWFLSIL